MRNKIQNKQPQRLTTQRTKKQPTIFIKKREKKKKFENSFLLKINPTFLFAKTLSKKNNNKTKGIIKKSL